MKQVLLIRGIPGAGKTTLANQMLESSGVPGCVLSADDFFMQDGEYRFDPRLLGRAHADCLIRFMLRLQVDGPQFVIVANTFIEWWEMGAYIEHAASIGARIDIHNLVPDSVYEAKEWAQRNVHGVSLDVIGGMLLRFEHSRKTSKVES